MAAYDLEEQEQLDELKTWWKMHGNLVTGVVTLAALAVLAWQGWNWWQRQQANSAQALYFGVQEAMVRGEAKRARELAGELIDKYPRTTYAGMGAMMSAKAQTEGGDLQTAQLQLAWAVEHARDDGMRELARLRLAALLLDQKAYDEALKQVAGEPSPAYLPRFNEVRGDIYAAQGKRGDAIAAYEAALKAIEAAMQEGGGAAAARKAYGDVLQAKRDALGVMP